MTARLPITNQPDLFSWESEMLGDAFRHLNRFEFDEADSRFKEVLVRDPDNDRALIGRIMTKQWGDIFRMNKERSDNEYCQALFRNIREYSFENDHLVDSFKKALLGRLIQSMERLKLFFIDRPISISDLYIEANRIEPAEKALEEYLEEFPNDGLQHLKLGNLYYGSGQLTQAGRSHILSILLADKEIDQSNETPTGFGSSINNPDVSALIEECGTNSAIPYGYLRGVFPQLHITPSEIRVTSSFQQKTLERYRLLYVAEQLRRSGDMKHLIEARKNLNLFDPEFYKHYYRWLGKWN